MHATEYHELGLLPPPSKCAVPGPVQLAGDILEPQLDRDPSAPAVACRHQRLSFGELDHAANAAAAGLAELGVSPGDRVAMSLENYCELVVAFLAVQRLGAIWVGINPALAAPEKLQLLADAGARLLIAREAPWDEGRSERALLRLAPGESSSWSAMVARHAGASRPAVALDPFAPAAIAYTSGTTGQPKGVVHSQHNLVVAAEARNRFVPEQIAPVDGVALPLTILNLMIMGPLSTLRAGSLCVCVDTLHPPELAEWIGRERIESMQMAPATLYDLLTRSDVDQSKVTSLSRPGVGGAHVPEALRTRYRTLFGREAAFGYGLTEAPTAVSCTREGEPTHPAASGRALEHLDVAILDEEGGPTAPGHVGEIVVGPVKSGDWAGVYTPMLGYWRNAGATASALRGGWLHTGDVGVIDASGQLFVKDRKGDLLLRGGANVYPAEVERVILGVPGVAACAVIGLADERLGQRIAAVIQPADEADADAVLAEVHGACARSLARYKIPERWRVARSLPRNAMGKIVKPALIRLFDESATQRLSVPLN
jgi:long-chain acyl-CoA synthetase